MFEKTRGCQDLCDPYKTAPDVETLIPAAAH